MYAYECDITGTSMRDETKSVFECMRVRVWPLRDYMV
jgi:hypothetical protein